jgi:excisionase family DNA binding protein
LAQLCKSSSKPTEVADRLSVSRAWVYDAAKVGRIPAIRVGGEDGPLRFVAEDLEAWLADARTRWTPGSRTVATRKPRTVVRRSGARRQRDGREPRAAQQSLL